MSDNAAWNKWIEQKQDKSSAELISTASANFLIRAFGLVFMVLFAINLTGFLAFAAWVGVVYFSLVLVMTVVGLVVLVKGINNK